MAIKSVSRQLLRDTRGVTLVLIALTLSALMGFTALGVETGQWYAIKRQNQTAADMAAISGAFELDAGQGYGLNGKCDVSRYLCIGKARRREQWLYIRVVHLPEHHTPHQAKCVSITLR